MALHFSSISSMLAAERAVARPQVARQPSTQSSLAQRELAQTVAAAATASSTKTTSTSTSGSTATAAAAASTSSSASSATAATTTPAPVSPAGPPTTDSVFGANPWLADPTCSGPSGSFAYNPIYFATAQTAATVASMVGGKVVAVDAVGGPASNPWQQDQPNEMVQLPNGCLINAGLVATFYTHGYPQSMVDQMVANEVTDVSKGI